MVRDKSIRIYVTEKEKQIIRKNALLHDYKTVASFLRDLGLNIDLSQEQNSTFLAILMGYLEKYSPDNALKWVRKKQKNMLKMNTLIKFAGMSKEQYEGTLNKLDETINNATNLKDELKKLLVERKEKLDSIVPDVI